MAIARTFLFVAVGLLLGAGPAHPQALLLFNNGSPDFLGGYEMTEWTVADDFEVTVSAEVTRGTFAMSDPTCSFLANWDGHLRWWIYIDSGGLPGSPLASAFAPEVSVTLDFDDCPVSAHYSINFKLGQMILLSTGTRYWLGLHMAADWSANDALYWGTTSVGNYSSGVSSRWGTEPWGTVGLEHSFSLEVVGDDDYLFVDGFESGDISIWGMYDP